MEESRVVEVDRMAENRVVEVDKRAENKKEEGRPSEDTLAWVESKPVLEVGKEFLPELERQQVSV